MLRGLTDVDGALAWLLNVLLMPDMFPFRTRRVCRICTGYSIPLVSSLVNQVQGNNSNSSSSGTSSSSIVVVIVVIIIVTINIY